MKINNAFVEGGSGGPRKLCPTCGVYYRWIGKTFRCPQCGTNAEAEDMIKSTRRVLKADVSEPFVKSMKKITDKDRLKPDLPKGAQLIRDDEY
jgi:hypothetical protein